MGIVTKDMQWTESAVAPYIVAPLRVCAKYFWWPLTVLVRISSKVSKFSGINIIGVLIGTS